ncbi:MAG: hypothetical protein PHR24_05515 [Oscillospiraceae bacterium]|nr:hypothetical protein [Oscillospiraceae bacterium]
MTKTINNYTHKNQPRELPLGWFVLSTRAHLILLSSKNQDIFAVCFPPYSVVVVGGRQPALLLRLA